MFIYWNNERPYVSVYNLNMYVVVCYIVINFVFVMLETSKYYTLAYRLTGINVNYVYLRLNLYGQYCITFFIQP